jgi:hypothetical protein
LAVSVVLQVFNLKRASNLERANPMKRIMSLLGLTTAMLITPVIADDSGLDVEFTKLQDQYHADTAAAVGPINQRYKSDLEELLNKAALTGDADEIVKIKAELDRLKSTINDTSTPSFDILTLTTGYWHFTLGTVVHYSKFSGDGACALVSSAGVSLAHHLSAWEVKSGRVKITDPETSLVIDMMLPLDPAGTKCTTSDGRAGTAVNLQDSK